MSRPVELALESSHPDNLEVIRQCNNAARTCSVNGGQLCDN